MIELLVTLLLLQAPSLNHVAVADTTWAIGVEPSHRFVPTNRSCQFGDDRPGYWHFVIDSPQITDEWLALHHCNSNSGSYGGNAVVSDFWYDGVERRVRTRSIILKEVDDPVDIKMVRAPGVYPNTVDFSRRNNGDVTGFYGFGWWSQNGESSYYAAAMGRDFGNSTGLYTLATAPGVAGRNRADSTYTGEELVEHIALHPNGLLELGWNTDPTQRPPEGAALARGGMTIVEADGRGNVVHDVEMIQASEVGDRVTAMCPAKSFVLLGGGGCDNGAIRATGPNGNGWEVVCSQKGRNKAYAVCARK